jgi:hypothetical protein
MAMNLYLKWACRVIIVVLALNLSACAAAPLPADGIESLYIGSTLYGIERALSGAPETFVMRSAFNPNWFILVWRAGENGWAFVLLDAQGSAKTWQSIAGNIGTPKTLTDLIDGAIVLKFRYVTNLSDASLALCRGYELAKSWITETANSLPVILVAPVAGFDLPGILPTPSGIQE